MTNFFSKPEGIILSKLGDSMSDWYHKSGHACFMLTELYIEALLVDEELADLVWEAWDVGLIPDDLAAIAWWQLSYNFDSGRPRWDC